MAEPHDAPPPIDPAARYDAPPSDSGAGIGGPPGNAYAPPPKRLERRGGGRNRGIGVAVVSLVVFAGIAVVVMRDRGVRPDAVAPKPPEELVDYEEAPAQPAARRVAVAAPGDDAVWDTPPDVLNGRELVQAMRSSYPPLLRDAGVGGSVQVRFRIREDGTVDRASMDVQTATNDEFARAARTVVPRIRFRPGTREGKAVPGWIVVPLDWRVTR
jgi:TonB family protein